MAPIRGSRAVVTGAAGFIGPHLVRALCAQGASAVGLDVNPRATAAARRGAPKSARFKVADTANAAQMAKALAGADLLFHLAADPDVRNSTAHPLQHFEINAGGTLGALEAARRADCRRIVFPSTSTVYGDASVVPTPEDYSPLRPISVYGASKLAAEGLLSAFASTYGMDTVALRFANVVGPGATHGVIVDLVEKLKRDPRRLEVLGDGRQRKSYVHVDDVIAGTLIAASKAPAGFSTFNIGSADTMLVDDIAGAVIRAMGLKRVQIIHKPAPGGRGWSGDVKTMQLSLAKIRRLGFSPRYSSRQAVEATARAVARERTAARAR